MGRNVGEKIKKAKQDRDKGKIKWPHPCDKCGDLQKMGYPGYDVHEGGDTFHFCESCYEQLLDFARTHIVKQFIEARL